VWASLDAALQASYRHESGVDLRIISAFVDSGFLTKHVYYFCANRLERHIYPSKGRAGAGHPLISRPTKLGPRLRLYLVGVDGAKELLYAHLRISEFGPGYQHYPRTDAFDREYFEQLTAEEMRTKFKNGFPSKVWVKTRARNEVLDCHILAMGALEARQVNFAEVAKDLERRISELNPEAPPPPKEEFTVSEAPPAAPPINPRFNRTRRRNPWVFRGW
jgi:phage terminase large subunit GpA-like protein